MKKEVSEKAKGTVTLFYLEDCPYCHAARKAFWELEQEDPRYGQVEVEWVEESQSPELAGAYEYYYVPTLFWGKKKLYEAHPSEDDKAVKRKIRAALDLVLEEKR